MSEIEKHTVPEGTYANDKLLGELHVNMSNILIRAAHGLNLVEKRIISVGVAKIDSMRIGTHGDFNQMMVRLDATVYGEEYGVDMKNAYAELRRASESLFEKYISIPKQTPNGLKEHKFRWVSGVFIITVKVGLKLISPVRSCLTSAFCAKTTPVIS